ncbi:MAG: hypothetical protein KF749_16495 [Bacteroidetes bacterium]|nr:hypothetical protein [Bacteroidota bacterium]MCW5896972.1 hypothetical protein [Bacteroidota bacterium]
MSLKAFHIIFIGVSALLAFGFALWLINGFATGGNTLQLVAGIASVVVASGLVVYGIRFMKRLKHVSML